MVSEMDNLAISFREEICNSVPSSNKTKKCLRVNVTKLFAIFATFAMLATAFSGCVGDKQNNPSEENAPYHPPTFGNNYSKPDNKYVPEKFTGTLNIRSLESQMFLHGDLAVKMRKSGNPKEERATFLLFPWLQIESITANGVAVDYECIIGDDFNTYNFSLERGLNISVVYGGNIQNDIDVSVDGIIAYAGCVGPDTYVMHNAFIPWFTGTIKNGLLPELDMTLKFPNFLKVIFNGNLTDTKEDTIYIERRYNNFARASILAVSTTWVEKTDEVNGIPIMMYYYPYSETVYADYLEGIKDAMPLYENIFRKYPYDTLTLFTAPQLTLPSISGSILDSTGLFATSGFAYGGVIGMIQGGADRPWIENSNISTLEINLAAYREHVWHEYAHNWWGCGVVAESAKENTSVWLSEGFANYCKLLVFFNTDPIAAMTHIQDYYDSTIGNSDTPLSNASGDHSQLNYEKGPLVIRNLEYVFAADGKKGEFFDGLRAFLDTYWHKTANTMQFRQVMEEYYNGDLGWFFDNWIFGTGFPDFSVKTVNGASVTVVNSGDVKSPVNVTASSSDGKEKTKIVWLEPGEEKTVAFDFNIERVILDKDWWVPERNENNNVSGIE
jgi:hypothetical protein